MAYVSGYLPHKHHPKARCEDTVASWVGAGFLELKVQGEPIPQTVRATSASVASTGVHVCPRPSHSSSVHGKDLIAPVCLRDDCPHNATGRMEAVLWGVCLPA